jgi:hypothetical protein
MAKMSKDEKIKTVLDGLASGKTREHLAEIFGYKDWRGLDVMMRREGYIYKNDRYVLPEEKESYQPEAFIPKTVKFVQQQLQLGKNDLATIAAMAGFKDRNELTNYMQTQGWVWSVPEKTYIKENAGNEGTVLKNMEHEDEKPEETIAPKKNEYELDFAHFLPLLKFLEDHKEHLELMLETFNSKQIPNYNFYAGSTITKSVSMGSRLSELAKDFADEMGVSQRVVFESALIQFMERYGYAQQIKTLLDT